MTVLGQTTCGAFGSDTAAVSGSASSYVTVGPADSRNDFRQRAGRGGERTEPASTRAADFRDPGKERKDVCSKLQGWPGGDREKDKEDADWKQDDNEDAEDEAHLPQSIETDSEEDAGETEAGESSDEDSVMPKLWHKRARTRRRQKETKRRRKIEEAEDPVWCFDDPADDDVAAERKRKETEYFLLSSGEVGQAKKARKREDKEVMNLITGIRRKAEEEDEEEEKREEAHRADWRRDKAKLKKEEGSLETAPRSEDDEGEDSEASRARRSEDGDSFKPKETESEEESLQEEPETLEGQKQQNEDEDRYEEEEAQEKEVDKGGAAEDDEEAESEEEAGGGDIFRERKRLGQIDMVATVECINVTSFEQSWRTLAKSKAAVIFFQEHKVKRKERRRHKKELRDLGWEVHFGPSDETGKVAAAGVGVMWRAEQVQVFPEKMRDEELNKAMEKGRVGKYIMDVGWDANYTVYPLYGMSGGTKQATIVTEAILQAVRREIKGDRHMPTMIAGDFNKEPSTIHSVKVLKKEENWTDVGEVADWWGRTPGEPTCRSRKRAKPSRIDGYVVNPAAMITIHDVEVEKHEIIPTHSIVRLEISRNAMKEERTYMRKVGSLKALFEKRIQELTKEMKPKEAREKREEEVLQLQAEMDQNFEEASTTFGKAKVAKDMDLYWKTWSKAVEDAYIKALDLGSKEAEKALRGRGKVTLIKKEPKKAKKAEETIRNEWAYEAHRNLKQARRAEQILYRSDAMGSTEKEKRTKYEDLNRQAARLVIKNAKEGEQWEKELSERMKQVKAKASCERKLENVGLFVAVFV